MLSITNYLEAVGMAFVFMFLFMGVIGIVKKIIDFFRFIHDSFSSIGKEGDSKFKPRPPIESHEQGFDADYEPQNRWSKDYEYPN